MKFGINENTHDLMLSDVINKEKLSKREYELRSIIKTIEDYTLEEVHRKMKYKSKLKNISFDKTLNMYTYNNPYFTIYFQKISNEHDVDTDAYRELISPERSGSCHLKSVNVGVFKDDSYIVTGYIIDKGSRYLHSVIESEISGVTFYYDWTKNLIMEKSVYSVLNNFTQKSRVKSSVILEDIKNGIFETNLSSKFYLVFRDELEYDLKRNDSIIIKKRTKS